MARRHHFNAFLHQPDAVLAVVVEVLDVLLRLGVVRELGDRDVWFMLLVPEAELDFVGVDLFGALWLHLDWIRYLIVKAKELFANLIDDRLILLDLLNSGIDRAGAFLGGLLAAYHAALDGHRSRDEEAIIIGCQLVIGLALLFGLQETGVGVQVAIGDHKLGLVFVDASLALLISDYEG